MKINILYIIWSLEVGGAERIVISLAKYINKDKYNPLVCCLNHKGKLAEELEKIGIKVIALDKKSGIDLSIIPKLIRVIKEHKIYIVHTHLWTADFWGRIATRLAGRRIIISTVHSVDYWKPRIFLVADKVLSFFTDKIIAVSDEVKNFYIKTARINKNKIITIYNGIDLNMFCGYFKDEKQKLSELGINQDTKIISIVGRLVEEKGHLYFLDTIKILIQQFPQIKGVIIGEGYLREKIVAKIEELKIKDNVILTGLRSDVPELLKLSKILISSSIVEGLPTVILEAMASGKPVVATSVGGNLELIEDGVTGFLVPPKNAPALAEKISLLLNNQELMDWMGANGQKIAREKFDIKKMALETEAIYDNLLAKKFGLNKKIKLALIIDGLGIGGAERQFIELAKNIDKKRYEIFVVSLSTQRIELMRGLLKCNLEVHLINQWGKFCIPAFIKLFKLLRKKRPDILHTYLFTASLYGRIVAKLIGIPVVIVSERSTDNWKKKSYVWTDRILAKVTDRIIVNAKIIKENLIKRERIHADKIRVIYNGIDLSLFNAAKNNREQIKKGLGIVNGNPVVGIIGRLSEEKDHRTFLKAAKSISIINPQVNFLIVGDGILRRELERFSLSSGINEKVIFAGNADNIPEILNSIDVFVSASLYEGCSNAILEAMAAGLPVVATKVGGNPEIVNDGTTGILVPPQNPDALAEAILSLLNNSELMQSMGKKGRERIEVDFLLSKMVKDTEEVYETLISQK